MTSVHPKWSASVYYAEIEVNCPIDRAWEILLDYPSWNPTFVNAEVTRVSGAANSEGEIVTIRKSLVDVKGAPLPEFYAQTVKVVPQRHITWYVYPKGEATFANFVDFAVTPQVAGVKFNIYYYEQNLLTGALLEKQRRDYQASMSSITRAFKEYCESHA